ncbi:MAG: tetratricopeptide repeat protein [Verrucomicrobiota bacterium]
MSRFGNLEFADESREQFRETPLQKDEAFYLAEAKAAFERGRFEQGLRAYAKVLEFNPQNAAAWTGQVRMLIELGEYREAKLWADKALESFPHEPELLAAKAVALGRSGDLKAAMAFSDASIEERGNTPYVWLARGDVLLTAEERRADYCFEKALALAPHNWFFPWLASRIYSFYKKFARALKLAQQALTLDATQAVIWLQLGRCQLALGLAGQAQNSLAQARQMDSECPETDGAIVEAANLGFWARLSGRWRHWFQK